MKDYHSDVYNKDRWVRRTFDYFRELFNGNVD